MRHLIPPRTFASSPMQYARMLLLTGLFPLGPLLLGGCSGAHEEVPAVEVALPATPRLASMGNFRDLAGADHASVYRTLEGRALKRGVFYRSDVVAPDDADWERLNALGITAVYDLRTPGEIAKAPDRVPQAAEYLNVNLLGHDNIDISMFTQIENINAERYLEDAERSMVSNPDIRRRLGELLTRMAQTEGAQLFHCTAGKDRTGWVAALLHAIAGVPEATIMADYLLSNTYSQARIEATKQQMREEYGPTFADALTPLMGVQESYLRAGFEQVVADYGSMEAYLREGLGLDEQVLATLRRRLVE